MWNNTAATTPSGAKRSHARQARPWHLPRLPAPAGGYRLVSVAQIAMVWEARRLKVISPNAFAAWWGWLEVLTRRSVRRLPADRRPVFRPGELETLLGGDGVDDASARRATRELVAAGLLFWEDGTPRLATSPDEVAYDSEGVFSFLERVRNRRRRVPIPRRWVRWLASGQRRSSAAAALATALRCLYVRQGSIDPNGSWAATAMEPVFGMSERSLRIGRKALEADGMLVAHPTPPFYVKRWGVRLSVCLTWKDGVEEPEAAEPCDCDVSSGRDGGVSGVSSGPLHQQPLPRGREKHQQPAAPRTRGVSVKIDREDSAKRSERPVTPNWRRITAADLHRGDRFEELRSQAVAAGRCPAGSRGVVAWWGAREHAERLVAERGGSVVRLFAWMVHRGAWKLITDGDEAAGIQRRASLRRAEDRRREADARAERLQGAVAPPGGFATFSADAKLLHAARGTLALHRLGPQHLLPMLRTRDQGWDPARVASAGAELNAWERARAGAPGDDGPGEELGAP